MECTISIAPSASVKHDFPSDLKCDATTAQTYLSGQKCILTQDTKFANGIRSTAVLVGGAKIIA